MGCCSSQKIDGLVGPDGQFLENNEFDMEGANPRASLKNKFVQSSNQAQLTSNIQQSDVNTLPNLNGIYNQVQMRPQGVGQLPLNNLFHDNSYQESVERYNVKYKPSE